MCEFKYVSLLKYVPSMLLYTHILHSWSINLVFMNLKFLKTQIKFWVWSVPTSLSTSTSCLIKFPTDHSLVHIVLGFAILLFCFENLLRVRMIVLMNSIWTQPNWLTSNYVALGFRGAEPRIMFGRGQCICMKNIKLVLIDYSLNIISYISVVKELFHKKTK